MVIIQFLGTIAIGIAGSIAIFRGLGIVSKLTTMFFDKLEYFLFRK